MVIDTIAVGLAGAARGWRLSSIGRRTAYAVHCRAAVD